MRIDSQSLSARLSWHAGAAAQLLVAGLLVIGLILAGTDQAVAVVPYADGSVNLSDGRTTLGGGGVTGQGTQITVWDQAKDGKIVHVNYVLKGGVSGSLATPDSSAGLALTRTVTTQKNPVMSYQVCAGATADSNDLCTGMTM